MSEVPRTDPRDDAFYQDMLDVFINRTKSLVDFPEPYRTKIKNAYRFFGQRSYTGDTSTKAILTKDTFDLM